MTVSSFGVLYIARTAGFAGRFLFTDAEINKLVDYLMGEICLISATREPSKTMIKRLPKLAFWYSVVRIGPCTGLRLGDICSLEWKCFDVAAMTMIVWTDKSDTRIILPITLELEPGMWIRRQVCMGCSFGEYLRECHCQPVTLLLPSRG